MTRPTPPSTARHRIFFANNFIAKPRRRDEGAIHAAVIKARLTFSPSKNYSVLAAIGGISPNDRIRHDNRNRTKESRGKKT
jgi:hypothetical protein